MPRALLPAPSRFVALLALVAVGLLAALLPVAPAEAKTKKKATPAFPTITKVTPNRARVGQQLTIRGKNYLVGKGRTTVVFKRPGKAPVFIKADLSTKTLLKVTLPKSLTTQLVTKDGYPIFTSFQLRIGAKRFGKTYTSGKLSVGPEVQADVDVDACAKVRTGTDPNGDLDGDFLTNAEELGLKNPLNPCTADSDGDTMTDGWEFFAAKDLNQRAVPYPAKRPFPNALDPADSGYDYDGDGLKAKQEFDLWYQFGRPSQSMANRDQLLYSDGTKTSSGPGPNQLADLPTLQANASACGSTVVPPTLGYMGRGYWDPATAVEDDEKDADHDGLTNWSEANGTLTQEWWKGVYDDKPYAYRNFQNTDPVDSDVDGDGCLDGLDDQDADDWPNWSEMDDHYATYIDGATTWMGFSAIGAFPAWYGWGDGATGAIPFASQPFNPCQPNLLSRTCSKYPVAGDAWPPFTDAYKDTGCPGTVTFMGKTNYVYLWNPAEDDIWTGSCPP